MITAAAMVSVAFYAGMMGFAFVMASIAHARGRVMAGMILLWPIWVLHEARRGDPFLVAASIILIVLVTAWGVFFLLRLPW